MRSVASPLTQDVSVAIPLPPSLTAAGELVLFETTNPFVMQPPQFGCLVVLASWFPPEAPVAMLVTYNVLTAPDGARLREVNVVHAAETFRGFSDAVDKAGERMTLPVAVGTWMFRQGRLQYHSADRTDRGDRWARKVGGVVPPRVQTATDEATSRNGERALERLNAQQWPTWRTVTD